MLKSAMVEDSKAARFLFAPLVSRPPVTPSRLYHLFHHFVNSSSAEISLIDTLLALRFLSTASDVPLFIVPGDLAQSLEVGRY